jgi:EAL domain-containing protein (putative c-di-GMP-specific phosphodiesterase class I)
MWYRPKRNTATGVITGFEALIRWQDAETGELIRPGHLIPVLEQIGLIGDVGYQALSKMVQDCKSWARQGVSVMSIAVNISLVQMREERFVSSMIGLRSELEQLGIALEIELTESVIMESIDEVIAKLQALREENITISIDDFGTGYSSLAYVSRLPIHALKIDKSFIFSLTKDKSSRAIVTSIISLAQSLDLGVVAEGVETAEQAEALRELQCDEVQGYFFGYPTAAEDVAAVVRETKQYKGQFS